MKKTIAAIARASYACCALFLLSVAVHSVHAQTAFPGALGFGANATGGRGGTVYHVTTLADSGPGSFRDAVSASNRIVVFDVSGYISLITAVSVKSNITIAGQTAAGGGIGFRGGEISFANSTNIICRYIRIRPGSDTHSTTDDALSFYRSTNVIVDHCSIEFAPWNNIDGVSDDWQNHPVNNITVQNSLIADPTGQQFGAHTEAVNGTWSWYYNIFANSHNRNPLAKINTIFVNNVLYNCSAGYTTHTGTPFKHDIINNYFIFGPASTGTDNTWYQVDKNQSIYYSGNLKDNNLDGALNGSATTPYWYQGPGTILTSPWSPLTNAVPPYNTQTAYRLTTSQAGALPYDAMDSLILNQVKTLGNAPTGTTAGTAGPNGSLYTTQAQTGLGNNGYGSISSGTPALDADGDGMPDYWEKSMGSNPNSNDAMIIGGDGYTLIEKYINWLADLHAITTKDAAADIDLSAYTGGFTGASPVFTVAGADNGTVSLLPDGQTAHFTPAAGFAGPGSFQFTVAASDGSAYTGTINVLVSAVANPNGPAAILAPSGTTLGAASFDLPAPHSTIQMGWTDNSNNEDFFVIERSADNIAYTDIAHPAANSSSYSDTIGLLPNTKYYYRLRAVNATDSSVYSTAVAVTTPPLPSAPAAAAAPTPANGVQYAQLSAGAITLKWRGGTNTDKYVLYTGSSVAGLSQLAEVAYTASPSFQLTGLTDNTTYYWRVDAVNNKGTATGTVWSFRTYPVLGRGLAGYWSFDETGDGIQVTDSSQYHNNGVLGIDADNSGIRVPGKKNNALDFATASQDMYVVSIPRQDQLYLDKSAFSLSFWMKAAPALLPQDNNTSAYLLCKGSITSNASTGATGKRFDIEFKNKQLRFAIDDDNDAGGGGKDELQTDGTPFFVSDWVHVVVIRDSANKKLQCYLNGILVKETAVSKANAGIGEASALIIGNIGELEFLSPTNKPAPYKGALDELKIYNYALSLPEIINLYYNAPLPQKPYAPSYAGATIDGYSDTLKLSWLGGINTTKYSVYIGADSAHLLRVADSIAVSNAVYGLADAAAQTTWYWRVDATGPEGTTTGDRWTFKTGYPKGLVAHYALDTTAGVIAFDSSRYANNGAVKDMPNAVWIKGKYKNALGYGKPGSTGAIVAPDAPQIRFDNNPFTISMWVKLPAYNTVSGKYDCYLLQKGTMENVAAGTGKWYGIQLKDKTLTFAIDDGITKVNADVTVTAGTAFDIFNKGWVHIVALRSRDINRIRVYINNVLAKSVDETSVTGTIGKASDLLIGNSPELKSFPDSLDDVRLYNYALSEPLIARLYNGVPLLKKPVNPYPADASTGAGPAQVHFSWTDSSGAATAYQLYAGTSPDSLRLLASGLPTPAYQLDSLIPSTTYYWRVRAASDVETAFSDIWSFTTGRDTTAPTVITKDISIPLDASGHAAISAADINNGSSDLYGIAFLALDKTSFGCADIGQDTVILTATDNHGNTASKTAFVTVQGLKPGTPAVTPADTSICNNGSALLTASAANAAAYQWYYQGAPAGGAVQSSYMATQAGVYSVTGISANACISDTAGIALVRISADTNLVINSDTTIFKGGRVLLRTSGVEGAVLWSPATGLQTMPGGSIYAGPKSSTTYTAVLTTPRGCTISRSFTLSVIDRSLSIYHRILTPNGDGINDRLIISNIKQYPYNTLQVYDIFGRPVYTATNYNNDWDGRVNGRVLPTGLYYFVLSVGHTITVIGTVTIIH